MVFSGHRKGVEGVVGHRGHMMALAVSSDGKFLVSEVHHTALCTHMIVIMLLPCVCVHVAILHVYYKIL